MIETSRPAHVDWRCVLSVCSVLFLAAPLAAQVAIYDFESGGDQGFGTGFGNDISATFPIVSIGGSNRMQVLDTASFQQAGRETGNPADPQFVAMLAASVGESVYLLSYDWYIDTSPGNDGTFLQLGTYVNTGSGYYAQDYPGAGKDVELNAVQLASGGVFSGTVSETFAAKGYDIPAAETFFRFGFIVNGDGTDAMVHFDNVRISPVPEPTSLVLIAAALPVFLRRRRVAREPGVS